MKKIFLLPVCFFFCFSLFGQDILVKRNGDEIKVKVMEILPEEIKYKMYDNLDGPMITIYSSEVHKIIYENGTETTINPLMKLESGKYKSRREPGKAAILSILYAGGGQYYNKEIGKGIVMSGAYTMGIIFLAYGFTRYYSWSEDDLVRNNTGLGVVGVFMALSTFTWSVIDAPVRASIINHRYVSSL